MSKINKISLTVFVIVIIILGASGFLFFKNRYASKTNTSQQKVAATDSPSSLSGTDDLTNDGDSDDNSPSNSSSDQNANSDQANDSKINQTDSFLNITTKDCNNKCKDYTDPSELKYCQESCGIAVPAKKADGCAAINDDLEKDYCFKDLALNKKDLKICDQISDTTIKKTCKNRLAEDIIDSIPQ